MNEPKREKVTVSIVLDSDLVQAIDRIAYDTRRTRSAVILEAVVAHVTNELLKEG